MPGAAENPQMMPLAEYIAEVMSLLEMQAGAAEICVERVKFLRLKAPPASASAPRRARCSRISSSLRSG